MCPPNLFGWNHIREIGTANPTGQWPYQDIKMGTANPTGRWPHRKGVLHEPCQCKHKIFKNGFRKLIWVFWTNGQGVDRLTASYLLIHLKQNYAHRPNQMLMRHVFHKNHTSLKKVNTWMTVCVATDLSALTIIRFSFFWKAQVENLLT